ncbi:MAG: bifunctional nuclease family protein [Myxococcales bacterium]|nr:bifunctional nuclease family protein [Myxococcales bacterium]
MMKVTGLTIDPFTSMPIIILKDMDEKCALPIWIGLIEASAIATELENIKLSRPMTHDLMKNMLESARITISRVEVNDLSDNTFYAKVCLETASGEVILDSRPSDAIAIALRTKSPIFVAKHVIDKSRKIDLFQENSSSVLKEKKWAEILESLSPEDFGKYKM